MKQMSHLMLIMLLCCLFSVGFNHQKAEAAATNPSFIVKPVLPPNQIQKELGYYYLAVKPGETQTIQFHAQNLSNKTNTLLIYPTVATTSDAAVILYNDTSSRRDDSLKIDFTKLVTKKKQVVKLKKNEQKDVSVTFKMPKKAFNGLVMGGIFVTTQKTENSSSHQQNKTKLVVKNKVGYAMAVGLRENDNPVAPKFNVRSVKPVGNSGNPAVAGNIQNSSMNYITDSYLKAWVTKRGSKKSLHDAINTSAAIAPNSNFNYEISWNNKRVYAGDYTYYATIKSGEKTWQLKRNFTITPSQANQLNAKNKQLPKDWTIWYIIVGILVLIFFGVVVTLFYMRGKEKGRNHQ